MFLETVIHNILLSMEPKYVPPAPEAIQFPKILTLFGKQGVRQVQKRSNLKLGIPIVPVPRVVQFCEFCWPLVWCDAKFGSGIQRSRGFQGHKNMRLVTKRMNIFTLPHGKKTSTWKDSHQPATNEKVNEWRRKIIMQIIGSAKNEKRICKEQDKQCMYNVTLGRVRATIVAVERQWVLHNLSVCICSLRHPASNAHAPYCHLWLAPLHNFFPHYKWYDFRKKKVTE